MIKTIREPIIINRQLNLTVNKIKDEERKQEFNPFQNVIKSKFQSLKLL